MEHFRRLTTMQLVLAACCACLAGGVLRSQDSPWAYLPLAVALICAAGAAAKALAK